MAILEEAFKGGNVVTGLAFGVGALVLAPLAVPLLRPVAKTVLKAGLVAYDQTRVAMAEMNERASDFVAEARAEMSENGSSEPRQPPSAERKAGRPANA